MDDSSSLEDYHEVHHLDHHLHVLQIPIRIPVSFQAAEFPNSTRPAGSKEESSFCPCD